jgi:hypothetical protein
MSFEFPLLGDIASWLYYSPVPKLPQASGRRAPSHLWATQKVPVRLPVLSTGPSYARAADHSINGGGDEPQPASSTTYEPMVLLGGAKMRHLCGV